MMSNWDRGLEGGTVRPAVSLGKEGLPVESIYDPACSVRSLCRTVFERSDCDSLDRMNANGIYSK